MNIFYVLRCLQAVRLVSTLKLYEHLRFLTKIIKVPKVTEHPFVVLLFTSILHAVMRIFSVLYSFLSDIKGNKNLISFFVIKEKKKTPNLIRIIFCNSKRKITIVDCEISYQKLLNLCSSCCSWFYMLCCYLPPPSFPCLVSREVGRPTRLK